MSVSKVLLRMESVSFRAGMSYILQDISLIVRQGEFLAVTGNSGSGKSSLGRIIAGLERPASGKLTADPQLTRIMVPQQDQFMLLSGRRSTYYGQRYEAQGMENTPSVNGYLTTIAGREGGDVRSAVEDVMEMMHIGHLSETKLLQLSNGERKRTQLASALLQKPRLLVLDQPFAGLDTDSRSMFTGLLDQLIEEGLSIVLICDAAHIPETAGHVLELRDGTVSQYSQREGFTAGEMEENSGINIKISLPDILRGEAEAFPELVRMEKVNIVIGEKQILRDISWTVKAGEQWVLQGPNGAGKTTLLSLITADNPQAYINNISLFGRKRGSGETIWDIKRKIGYVSPELHLYFLRGAGIANTIPGLSSRSAARYDGMSCLEVLLSGFRDETGFASAPSDLQKEIAQSWLRVLGMDDLANRHYIRASFGQQRLLLLGRALVKSPALLILDEPCQGLDYNQRTRFISLLNTICTQLGTALIYVTHMQEEIPPCAGKMIRLDEGQVTYCGSFPELTL